MPRPACEAAARPAALLPGGAPSAALSAGSLASSLHPPTIVPRPLSTLYMRADTEGSFMADRVLDVASATVRHISASAHANGDPDHIAEVGRTRVAY